MTTLYQPLLSYTEIQADHIHSETVNFMKAFQGGQACKNSLRLLSTENLTSSEPSQIQQAYPYFCLHEQNELSSEKKFFLVSLSEEGRIVKT